MRLSDALGGVGGMFGALGGVGRFLFCCLLREGDLAARVLRSLALELPPFALRLAMVLASLGGVVSDLVLESSNTTSVNCGACFFTMRGSLWFKDMNNASTIWAAMDATNAMIKRLFLNFACNALSAPNLELRCNIGR